MATYTGNGTKSIFETNRGRSIWHTTYSLLHTSSFSPFKSIQSYSRGRGVDFVNSRNIIDGNRLIYVVLTGCFEQRNRDSVLSPEKREVNVLKPPNVLQQETESSSS